MKTKPEGIPALTDTVGNVSSEMLESKKEEFLNIQKKWRNRQKGFKWEKTINIEGKKRKSNQWWIGVATDENPNKKQTKYSEQ